MVKQSPLTWLQAITKIEVIKESLCDAPLIGDASTLKFGGDVKTLILSSRPHQPLL
jgi:hypothetical protein